MVAVRVPAANGAKVTEIVQLEPAANDDPQPVVAVKSAALLPVIPTEIPVSASAAGFVRVSVCAADLEPTVVLLHERLAGVSDGADGADVAPVPLSVAV